MNSPSLIYCHDLSFFIIYTCTSSSKEYHNINLILYIRMYILTDLRLLYNMFSVYLVQ